MPIDTRIACTSVASDMAPRLLRLGAMQKLPLPAVTTDIPARLDRLPWSRFHWLVLLSLGVTWILDGFEITLKGAVSGVLLKPETLHFTPEQIGSIASFYLVGAVLGSLLFGYLTDRFGRKRLFFVTLSIYLAGAILTVFSWDLESFILFRFITGAGIGGEYAAINSVIDELIPARLRGRVGLLINGSYWLGAALGGLLSVVLLDPALFPIDIGWRVGFALGAILSCGILLVRKRLPESPRWLVYRGRHGEAEQIVKAIEHRIEQTTGQPLPRVTDTITIYPRRSFGFGVVARTVFGKYLSRAMLSLVLMGSQAFLYNAIFFTYALVLTTFYAVPGEDVGSYLLPMALGNFMGPLLLGRFFDTIGRRQMICFTYAMSALILFATGYMFLENALTAVSQTVLWTAVFFFASPAASAAYVTVSEIFPLEIRALAIAFFYSVGTAAGGIVAPWLFGTLIGTSSRSLVFWGYAIGAFLMVLGAAAEALWGVKAERASLESIAAPLSS